MKHKFYVGTASEKAKIFKFYKAFSPTEVSVLAYLYDNGNGVYGTYGDITTAIGEKISYSPNIRKCCIRLAESGWIYIESATNSVHFASPNKHRKKFGLTSKFAKEFMW